MEAVYTCNLPLANAALSQLELSSEMMRLMGCLTSSAQVKRHLVNIVQRPLVDSNQLLTNCNLMHALNAVLLTDDLATVRVALCAMRTLAGHGQAGVWRGRALEAGLHITLTGVLLRTDLTDGDVDALCTQLSGFTAHQSVSVLMQMYAARIARCICQHMTTRGPVLRLTADLLRCNCFCRYILRRQVMAKFIAASLTLCVELGSSVDSCRYIAAAECAMRLSDNDLPRTSIALASSKTALVSALLRGCRVAPGGKACNLIEFSHSLRIARSLLGRGVTRFTGQSKERKLPPVHRRDAASQQWAQLLGSDFVSLVAASTRFAGQHLKAAVLVIDRLCTTVQLSRPVALAVVQHLCAHINSQQTDLFFVKCLLQAVKQVCLAGDLRLSVDVPCSLKVTCSIMSMQQRFEYICRPKRFYHYSSGSDTSTCSICLDQVDPQTGCKSYCQHIFHTACLLQWLSTTQSCPSCRADGLDVVEDLMSFDATLPFSVGTTPPAVTARRRPLARHIRF